MSFVFAEMTISFEKYKCVLKKNIFLYEWLYRVLIFIVCERYGVTWVWQYSTTLIILNFLSQIKFFLKYENIS